MIYMSAIRIFVVLLIIAFHPANSIAGDLKKAATQKEFNAAFNKMLDDPANIDLTIKYANIAIALEDYEAAIPPLERLLLFNPDLHKIKQELGVLYYRLGSLDMAKSYLQSAKEGNNVPKDVIELADQYLNKIK
jgi:tetratricopeptide (TPR) repeat protein